MPQYLYSSSPHQPLHPLLSTINYFFLPRPIPLSRPLTHNLLTNYHPFFPSPAHDPRRSPAYPLNICNSTAPLWAGQFPEINRGTTDVFDKRLILVHNVWCFAFCKQWRNHQPLYITLEQSSPLTPLTLLQPIPLRPNPSPVPPSPPHRLQVPSSLWVN